jgi:dolichol-phosphate mannosyltransferase
MEAASGNILIVMDADLQHDETIIPDMITKIEKSDIVIASRSVSQFGYGKFSLHRKMLSKVANLLARILFGIKSKDPLSGYFAIRREVFEELSPKINPRGFKILLEFLARARNKKVDEVGYIFKERVAGETKLNSIVMLDFIVALLDIILAGKLSPTFIKYSFIGLSGIIVNLFGQFITNFLFHLDSIQLGYFVLSLGVINGFILSAISNFILNNYWTFRDNKLEGSLALQGFFTFLIIACIGLLIQISVWRYSLGIVIQFLESKSFNIANLSCNLLGILAATASNYALSKKLTWKN